MRIFFIYLSCLSPIFAFAQVENLRAVLEEDLNLNIKIVELKKEQNLLRTELELAMQNTQALIDSYEAKTKAVLEQNKEQNFKKKILLDELYSTKANLDKLEANIAKIYEDFKASLDEVPLSLRELYSKHLKEIDGTAYANSSEKNLAILKFLSAVSSDTQNYKVLDNCVVFGLNTEFYKQSDDVNIKKLFEIIENNSSYEILELPVERK